MNFDRFQQIITAQEKRGFDKYALGPFLMFVGVKFKKLPKKVRRALVAAGVFQIFYNWKDYAKFKTTVAELPEMAKTIGVKKDG